MTSQIDQQKKIRRVAIVGSGLAGLTTALRLREHSCHGTVFEKSRGPGGRLSSKRVPNGSADVGAQYFTIRDPGFMEFLKTHSGEETLAPWQGRFGYQKASGQWESFPDETRYVGVPRMTAISRALSSTVELKVETRIRILSPAPGGWLLTDTNDVTHGPFDAVVITAPPAQARDLLADSGLVALAGELEEPVRHVQPCWAVAAHFPAPPFDAYQGMRVHNDVLNWAANNSSKPGREVGPEGTGQWWVLHANEDWSHANENTPADQVAARMIKAFQDATGSNEQPVEVVTHRWLYAKSSGSAAPGYRWFPEERIGLAGDWLSGGRVEGAFESASGLVSALFPE